MYTRQRLGGLQIYCFASGARNLANNHWRTNWSLIAGTISWNPTAQAVPHATLRTVGWTIQPWFRKAPTDHIARFDEETLLRFWVPCTGRTPLQYALSVAKLCYNIWEDGKDATPSIRVAPDFDFFKNEPGHKYRACNHIR